MRPVYPENFQTRAGGESRSRAAHPAPFPGCAALTRATCCTWRTLEKDAIWRRRESCSVSVSAWFWLPLPLPGGKAGVRRLFSQIAFINQKRPQCVARVSAAHPGLLTRNAQGQTRLPRLQDPTKRQSRAALWHFGAFPRVRCAYPGLRDGDTHRPGHPWPGVRRTRGMPRDPYRGGSSRPPLVQHHWLRTVRPGHPWPGVRRTRGMPRERLTPSDGVWRGGAGGAGGRPGCRSGWWTASCGPASAAASAGQRRG